METAMAGKYSVHLRYEQHQALFSRKTTQASNGRAATTLTTGRTIAFTLDIRMKTAAQLPEQAKSAVPGKTGGPMAGVKTTGAETVPLPSTPEEAAEMIGEEGYWGIKKTAARLAEFVIRGAGDDLELLRAGRAGILKGFREAEALWGSTLPEISHQTMETALAAIDERIRNLDGTVVDAAA